MNRGSAKQKGPARIGSHLLKKVVLLGLLVFFVTAPSFETAGWDIQTVDSIGDVGFYTSIARDDSGRPHISYWDFTNSDLKYAYWTGSAWNIQTVDSNGDVGLHTSIALDDSGRPHISYRDDTNIDLKYAYWTGSAWNIQTVDSTGDVGYYNSIAVDDSGRPHISYRDVTNLDLKYAYWTGSAWTIQTVDSTGNSGWYTSIVLDDSGSPHISYRDGFPNQILKYAYWTSSAWNIQAVDSIGSVGFFTSIALDGSGRPHISYNDNMYNDLKYAYWADTAVEEESVISDQFLDFRLMQNQPNPFNRGTTIRFTLPEKTHVTLTIQDLAGRTVTTLVNEERSSGIHEVEWKGEIPSGIYFYRLSSQNFSVTKKLVILK